MPNKAAAVVHVACPRDMIDMSTQRPFLPTPKPSYTCALALLHVAAVS